MAGVLRLSRYAPELAAPLLGRQAARHSASSARRCFFSSVASALAGLLCIIVILLYIFLQYFFNPAALRTDSRYRSVHPLAPQAGRPPAAHPGCHMGQSGPTHLSRPSCGAKTFQLKLGLHWPAHNLSLLFLGWLLETVLGVPGTLVTEDCVLEMPQGGGCGLSALGTVGRPAQWTPGSGSVIWALSYPLQASPSRSIKGINAHYREEGLQGHLGSAGQ